MRELRLEQGDPGPHIQERKVELPKPDDNDSVSSDEEVIDDELPPATIH